MTAAPTLTEKAFMDQVTQLAEIRGFLWMHVRAGRTDTSWRTPMSGPLGKGWPDLVLARPRDRRFMLVELKRDASQPTDHQRQVLRALESCVAEVYLWRPRDWSQIEATLR
jgi:hypothetical protein